MVLCKAAFASDLNSLPNVIDWLQNIRPQGVSDAIWSQVQTAVLEGFSNAVIHAHAPLQNPPDLFLTFRFREGRVGLTIKDSGAPFDIETAFEALPQIFSDCTPVGAIPDVQAMPEAHWGLFLLFRLRRDYGWQILYEPLHAGGNLLVMNGP